MQTQTHILPYWFNVSKPARKACFEEFEVVDKCNEIAVSQLPKWGTVDGAATHRAPLRAPLELVPFTGNGASSSGTRRADNVRGQFETGYYAFGARYYDCDLLGIFLSVDPMADKYPSISPYAYCAWNPMKLVDPDGREIIIKDGKNCYYYVKGHVYANKNGRGLIFDSQLGEEASKIKENLDKMSNDNAGEKVVNRLTNSKDKYTIAADAKTGDGSYSAFSNKVSLVSGKLNNMEALSHELFHAYQDDNGRIPQTVYNEVEAYIFSGMMSGKKTMGMMSDKNPEYSKHANNMMKGFSNKSFDYLVSHFRRDSKANNLKGTYNSYRYNPGKYTIGQSLLRDLYK